MNLFNYLMNKKDKNIVDSDRLLEYLLNRGRLTSESGITISIDTQKTKINKLILTKESSQETTQGLQLANITNYTTKRYNVDVSCVNNEFILNGTMNTASSLIGSPSEQGRLFFAHLLAGTYTFVFKKISGNINIPSGQSALYLRNPNNVTIIERQINSSTNIIVVTFTLSEETNIYFQYYVNASGWEYMNYKFQLMILSGTYTASNLPDFEPYTGGIPAPNLDYPEPINTVIGDITLTITGSEDNNEYTISLGDNELVGKLNVLDELIIDKKGHCYLNKKFDKIDSYNGEVITTDYWSTTGGLDIGATIYYVLEEPELIDLDIDIDIELFKGLNTISNSVNASMKLYYYE